MVYIHTHTHTHTTHTHTHTHTHTTHTHTHTHTHIIKAITVSVVTNSRSMARVVVMVTAPFNSDLAICVTMATIPLLHHAVYSCVLDSCETPLQWTPSVSLFR